MRFEMSVKISREFAKKIKELHMKEVLDGMFNRERDNNFDKFIDSITEPEQASDDYFGKIPVVDVSKEELEKIYPKNKPEQEIRRCDTCGNDKDGFCDVTGECDKYYSEWIPRTKKEKPKMPDKISTDCIDSVTYIQTIEAVNKLIDVVAELEAKDAEKI